MIFIGNTLEDKIDLYLSYEDRTTHVQIIGSTGRGKTQSVIIPWAARDIARGKSTIIIDGKGSYDIPQKLEEIAEASPWGHRLLKLDLNDFKKSGVLNPLRGGSSQQITDRLFSSLTFEEPYYRSVQLDICGNLVKLLLANNKEVNLKKLYKLLTDDNDLANEVIDLEHLIKDQKQKIDLRNKTYDPNGITNLFYDAKAEHAEEDWDLECNEDLCHFLRSYLNESKKDRDRKVHGLVSQISPFATGELSRLVNPKINQSIDQIYLDDIITNNGWVCSPDKFKHTDDGGSLNQSRTPYVLVVSIPSLKYQDSGHILGKLVLQSIASAIGERESKNPEKDGEESKNNFLSVFLDEFSEFVYPKFISVLNKARSANVAFHLSHQSMGDLDIVSESFAKSVMTNTNIKCVLGLNDPVTADYFARHFGTETEEKTTEQVDGESWGEFKKTGRLSLREADSFKISPNVLKALYHGHGVLHLPSKRGTITEEIWFKSFGWSELSGERVKINWR